MSIRRMTLMCLVAAAGLAQSPKYGVGRTPKEQEIHALSYSIAPDGAGLPPGAGTSVEGRVIFAAHCASCHGEKGTDARWPLVGGQGTLATAKPLKTVGSFWPHATSVWNYVNRAMPFNRPGLLTPPEVYAVVAHILYMNGIIAETHVLDAKTLPKVQMPNRDGFVADPRPDVGGSDVAFVTMTPHGVAKVHEGAGRARRRLAPCSTFKIPNAAIGLETGVIPGPEHVLKYDEKKHKTQAFWPDEWARDQDLRTAFRVSAIWYFREIAERAGRPMMQAFLDRFGYGNRDTTGWADPFWIRSSLRISPVEQVEFMDRLFRNEYGLTPKNVAAVESFMLQDTREGRELYYKTGACTDLEAGPEVWLVGFVKNGAERTYFAMSAGAASMDAIFSRRVEFGKERLVKYGLWPR